MNRLRLIGLASILSLVGLARVIEGFVSPENPGPLRSTTGIVLGILAFVIIELWALRLYGVLRIEIDARGITYIRPGQREYFASYRHLRMQATRRKELKADT